jgi:hypothetical protein
LVYYPQAYARCTGYKTLNSIFNVIQMSWIHPSIIAAKLSVLNPKAFSPLF